MNLFDRIVETADALSSRFNNRPEIGIVLGTGLGGFVDEIDVEQEIPYEQVLNFPISTVAGHDGKLIYGRLEGKWVLALKGRFHFYEGYSMDEVTFPIRVMRHLGIQTLVLSNACGGMNPAFMVGDIMLIKDQINLFPTNPLIGFNDERLGPRFPDMSEPYDLTYLELMRTSAKELNLKLHEGVYAGLSGPCFETPAEYKYIRTIGADAVGMSTVPENIVAKHAGMKVVALSVITDLGIEGEVEVVSHEEVQKAASDAEPKMAALVKTFLKHLS